MGQFTRYFGLLIVRAAQNSVLLTDKLTILIVPFSTLVLWMTGARMTESVQEALALGVALSVIAVVALRLIAASYFVWRDDQAEKQSLFAELEDPEREAHRIMKLHTLELRKRLGDRLGRLAAYSTYSHALLAKDETYKSSFYDLMSEIDSLINQLSYDFPLRISSLRLRDYCLELLREKKIPDKHFWEQRRITFRLINKQDNIADFMSLMELEVLLEDAGRALPQEIDSVDEIKAMIRKLGPRYHEEDVQMRIRASLREGSSLNIG